jgi:seryl-tRNA synthetase
VPDDDLETPTPPQDGGAPTPKAETPDPHAEGLRKELAAVRAEAAKLKAEKEQREREAAEAQGQFKQLYESERDKAKRLEAEAEDAKLKLTAYQQAEQAKREERIAKLPEHLRKGIPDGLTGAQQDHLLAAIEADLEARNATTRTGDESGRSGGGGGDPEALTEAEKAHAAGQSTWWQGTKLIVSPARVREHFRKFGPGARHP